MKTMIAATYEGGIFRPDESLPLAERTRVNLTVEPIVQTADATRAWESLKARLRQRPIHGLGRRYTRDELHERR